MNRGRSVLLLTSKTGSWTSLESLLVRRLREHDVDPVLVSPHRRPSLEDSTGRAVVTEYVPGLRDLRTLRGVLALPVTLIQLRRIVERQGATVLHSLRGSLAPAALRLSRMTGVPHLCHMRFIYRDPSKYRKLRLHRAENVAGVSQAVIDAFVAACGDRRPARMQVIPNGIDADAFVAMGRGLDVRTHFGIPPEAVVLGMVGSMDPLKDPQSLLRAVPALAGLASAVHLLFVGRFRSADYERATRRLVDALGLGGRCHFAGFQLNPSPFFRAMDVFVLPSHSEAHPLVLLEAMAHALPIVATRVGGILDTLEDGVTGLVVEAGDVEGLERAIAPLVADAGRRRQLGAEARRRVEQELSATRCLDRIVALYGTILRGERGVARGARAACRSGDDRLSGE